MEFKLNRTDEEAFGFASKSHPMLEDDNFGCFTITAYAKVLIFSLVAAAFNLSMQLTIYKADGGAMFYVTLTLYLVPVLALLTIFTSSGIKTFLAKIDFMLTWLEYLMYIAIIALIGLSIYYMSENDQTEDNYGYFLALFSAINVMYPVSFLLVILALKEYLADY